MEFDQPRSKGRHKTPSDTPRHVCRLSAGRAEVALNCRPALPPPASDPDSFDSSPAQLPATTARTRLVTRTTPLVTQYLFGLLGKSAQDLNIYVPDPYLGEEDALTRGDKKQGNLRGQHADNTAWGNFESGAAAVRRFSTHFPTGGASATVGTPHCSVAFSVRASLPRPRAPEAISESDRFRGPAAPSGDRPLRDVVERS
jgi:hypothetical protein